MISTAILIPARHDIEINTPEDVRKWNETL
jgi:hypothetical protein